MAGTSKTIADSVRRIIRDPNNGRPVIPDDTINQATDRVVPQVADACSLNPTLVSPLLTLVAGTATYTLTTGDEYDYLSDLYFTSDRAPLFKRSLQEINRHRDGDTGRSRPQFYCIEPQSDQSVDVTVWPTPASAEVVAGMLSALPDAWGTSGAAPTIPFSQRALRAVELRVAAAVVAPLNSEALVQLRLDKSAIGLWQAEAANLEQRERLLVSRLRNTHGPTHTWLSAWRTT